MRSFPFVIFCDRSPKTCSYASCNTVWTYHRETATRNKCGSTEVKRDERGSQMNQNVHVKEKLDELFVVQGLEPRLELLLAAFCRVFSES